jgi:hypothetical protein
MKSEIPVDQAAPGARVPRVSLRMALTVTTHHLDDMHRLVARGGWAGACLLPLQVGPPQLRRVTIDS